MQAENKCFAARRRRSIITTIESCSLYTAEYRTAVQTELVKRREIIADLDKQRQQLKRQLKNINWIPLETSRLTISQQTFLSTIPSINTSLHQISTFAETVAFQIDQHELHMSQLQAHNDKFAQIVSTTKTKIAEEISSLN